MNDFWKEGTDTGGPHNDFMRAYVEQVKPSATTHRLGCELRVTWMVLRNAYLTTATRPARWCGRQPVDSLTIGEFVPWCVQSVRTKFCKSILRSFVNSPDSKVHGAHMGAQLGPTGPRWAPCGLRESCYLEINPVIVACSRSMGMKTANKLHYWLPFRMSK